MARPINTPVWMLSFSLNGGILTLVSKHPPPPLFKKLRRGGGRGEGGTIPQPRLTAWNVNLVPPWPNSINASGYPSQRNMRVSRRLFAGCALLSRAEFPQPPGNPRSINNNGERRDTGQGRAGQGKAQLRRQKGAQLGQASGFDETGPPVPFLLHFSASIFPSHLPCFSAPRRVPSAASQGPALSRALVAIITRFSALTRSLAPAALGRR